MEVNIENIHRLSGDDLRDDFMVRYRLASDPDVDGSYTTVTTYKDFLGIRMPNLDFNSLSPGVYVVHSYFISSGTSSGTKVTISVLGEV